MICAATKFDVAPFLAVPWGCLQFVILVFPDYTHLLLGVDTFARNATDGRKDGLADDKQTLVP